MVIKHHSYNYWHQYEGSYWEPLTVINYYLFGYWIWQSVKLCANYKWIQENPHD